MAVSSSTTCALLCVACVAVCEWRRGSRARRTSDTGLSGTDAESALNVSPEGSLHRATFNICWGCLQT